jgi:uncharacterized protein YndB with AHSA1/START domain
MERKTRITAEPGQHDLFITREFELPLELLFKAHSETEIIEQWMSTKVIKLENKKHGNWRYETSNPEGIIVFSAHGTIHEFLPGKKIVRTFEMDNASFDVQLEFLEFEAIDDDNSRLTIQSIYRTPALRDEMLKLPFSYGVNMAHDRLQEIVSKLK